MKRLLSALFMSSFVIFAQSYDFNTLEGLNESLRVIEIAYRAGASEKDPYHYEKARAYSKVSMYLASEEDTIGSKIFAIKSMNSASKSLSDAKGLDPIEFYTQYNNPLINLTELNEKLLFVRENKGDKCAPIELAKAEASYEGLTYEVKKEKPNSILVLKLYNDAINNTLVAYEKVRSAMEDKLECYVGRAEIPIVRTEEQRAEEKPREEAQKPLPTEEPLLVRARVHFDFNKANIKKEYIPLLNEVVKTLKENPNIRVRIEGYTDDIGSKAYNDKLALQRAKAVKDYLVKNGIEESRIEVVGFGKEKYIADNETPIGRFTNRRADFVVISVPVQ